MYWTVLQKAKQALLFLSSCSIITPVALKKYSIAVMANVAQLVRAPGCGSGGRGFDPHRSPQIKTPIHIGVFIFSTGTPSLLLCVEWYTTYMFKLIFNSISFAVT